MASQPDDLVQDVLITAILLLDTKGERIITKYYPNPNKSMKSVISLEDQQKLEQSLTNAVSRSSFRGEMDICIVDSYVGVYSQHDDVRLFVVIDSSESETIASMLLATLSQGLQYLFDFRVNKGNILNAIDLVMFLLDECVDNGYILELDADEVLKRVSMRDKDDQNPDNVKSFQQQDTSLANAIGMATSAFFRGWQ